MTVEGATRRNPHDAISLLLADHQKVTALFRDFEEIKGTGSAADKLVLVQQICDELTIHAVLEEEVFYPAVRVGIDADDLMDEALVEHAAAKGLIAALRDMSPEGPLYDAKVTVLGQQIQHHVTAEESEMFPKARKAQVDTETLGFEMSARKAELLEELGIEDPQANAGGDPEEPPRARL